MSLSSTLFNKSKSISSERHCVNVIWFRNDLRCHDNAVLCSAVEHASIHNIPVIGIFIATPQTWQQHNMAPIKQDLIRRRVLQLSEELKHLNIRLLAIEGSSYQQVPHFFRNLSKHYKVTVFAQREYESREIRRDAAVQQLLTERDGELIMFDTQCVMPPGSLQTQQGGSFKVYSPFKRRWLQQLSQAGVHCHSLPLALSQQFTLPLPTWPPLASGDNSSAQWPVEETVILRKLREFCRNKIFEYNQQRDFPAIDGTSGLSAYLAIGAISAAQCVARLQLESGPSWQHDKSGPAVWLSELIWREFYKHIMVSYPRLIKHQPFQEDTAAIVWTNDKTLFNAWCEGRTGYPIVDAAMRQLNQTGWMHNRLRMISASFLVKDLHIDWRWGEQYFMSRLIDGDFAANNGGWQWAASTGTDAVPYFRIFNPVTQSKRFDLDGSFIRKYVPEIAHLSGTALHWPHPLSREVGYPAPIVDHRLARQQTLALFSEVKKS